MQNELIYEYEQILAQINTYDEYEKTIQNNLKLYEDLIMVNKSSNSAGMTADYDLEVLQNTQKINEYDERVFKIAPILKEKQRHVELYGVAQKGTWSENISRQLSVPERQNFKKWLKGHGINLE